MHEVQRHAVVAPFAVPHVAKEDAEFRGFHIPKYTGLTLNLVSFN